MRALAPPHRLHLPRRSHRPRSLRVDRACSSRTAGQRGPAFDAYVGEGAAQLAGDHGQRLVPAGGRRAPQRASASSSLGTGRPRSATRYAKTSRPCRPTSLPSSSTTRSASTLTRPARNTLNWTMLTIRSVTFCSGLTETAQSGPVRNTGFERFPTESSKSMCAARTYAPRGRPPPLAVAAGFRCDFRSGSVDVRPALRDGRTAVYVGKLRRLSRSRRFGFAIETTGGGGPSVAVGVFRRPPAVGNIPPDRQQRS